MNAIKAMFDAYGEFATFSSGDVEQCLRVIKVPFDATYRHRAFIARR
jgi:hypothetical protein